MVADVGDLRRICWRTVWPLSRNPCVNDFGGKAVVVVYPPVRIVHAACIMSAIMISVMRKRRYSVINHVHVFGNMKGHVLIKKDLALRSRGTVEAVPLDVNA